MKKKSSSRPTGVIVRPLRGGAEEGGEGASPLHFKGEKSFSVASARKDAKKVICSREGVRRPR